MKTKIASLLSILLIFQAPFVVSAEKSKYKEDKDQYNKLNVNEDMQKILEIAAVKKIYDSCLKDYAEESTDRQKGVSDCLWAGVQKDTNLKKEVLATMNAKPKSQSGSRAPASGSKEEKGASSKTDYTDKKINIANDYQSDPAVKALSEFYAKKLAAVLDPNEALTEKEKKANMLGTVDHRLYIDLYKSQLGKTIINAFTSYCIEANPECGQETVDSDGKPIKQDCRLNSAAEKRAEDKAANIASLKGQNLNLDADSASSKKWQYCITSVTDLCTNPPNEETKKRSCTIVDFVKSARQSLQAADSQIAFYNKLEGPKYDLQAFENVVELGTKNKDDLSNDNLAMITSKDVETTLGKVKEKEEKEIDLCFTSAKEGQEAQIVDALACEKYLNKDKEKSQRELAEFTLRQELKGESLNENIQDDEYLKKYLKEEGYTDEQIAEMTKDKAQMTSIREIIVKRFKNEKEALIAEMREKIDSTTTTVDGKVTQDDISKLSAIKEELMSRSTDLSQLVQFNNLVSSYLTIEDEKANTSRNVASLFAEYKTLEGEDAKVLEEKLKEAKLEDKKGTANLALDSLNANFLKYFNQKPKEGAKK